MSAATMMTRTATLIRRTPGDKKDRGGNRLTGLAEEEIRCALQQRRRNEHEDRGEISDTLWSLYMPFGTEVAGVDAVRVDGQQYEIVGDPWVAQEGSRSLWHVEATVRRTSGTGESVS